MFVPEYSITAKTLKNIANIEYSKAIIETSTILPHWQKQIEKEARVRTLVNALLMQGLNVGLEEIKRHVDLISPSNQKEVLNLNKALEHAIEISRTKDLDEDDFKELHRTLTQDLIPKSKSGIYRSQRLPRATHPEEILAEMVELMDWYNSLDSHETHPVIRAGILKAKLETVIPFEQNTFVIATLAARMSLRSNGYELKDYLCLEEFYNRSKYHYEQVIQGIGQHHQDFTKWLEYFTEGISNELANIKEKVNLLARDTKVAKASGRVKLTPRQERIVEHLQDYGILQNKDFPRLFPGVSEDSILRDLKLLMSESIVIKTGSTKSSRYELH